MADPPRLPPDDFCPYVGLQPFTSGDQAFFFGREKEQRVISANLFAAPLTILYGPSAVGKSSVLQAGVAPRLSIEPRTAVVYFARWQGDDYVSRLKTAMRLALTAVHREKLDVDDALPLDGWVGQALTQFRGALLLMLDQFEEYLLYHREADEHALDSQLARLVNQQDGGAHVLIGLRDDSLSKLNRFSKRIPNLLGNTLQLHRLSPDAARRAIVGPIDRYVEMYPDARPTRVERSLVDRVIADVQIENVASSVSGGIAGLHLSEDRGLIETAFLQLVMTELWQAASARSGDRVLNADRLDELGGAKAIVRRHVEREMTKLNDQGREIAAKLFLHLVTPSGAKYALQTRDLVEISEQPADAVMQVLTPLTEARLLRRLDPPERYEIFHDAFAVALLDWRKAYLQDRVQARALREAEARRSELVRRRVRTALIAGAGLLLIASGVYLVHEIRDRNQLAANLAIAESAAQKAAQATDAAISAAKQADAEKRAGQEDIAARELALRAERARLDGDIARANDLQAQQAERQRMAAQARSEAERYAQQSQAKLAEAQQSQTRIDGLVQAADKKGYTVSQIGAPPAAGTPAEAAAPPPVPKASDSTADASRSEPANTPAATPGYRPPVSGDFRAAYRKAIAAADMKHWKEAQGYLETSLRINANDTGEMINISGAGNFEPYLPHFYLGLALRSQSNDNCPEALKQFDLSERDGKVEKTRLYKQLQQQRSACEGRK